MTQQFKIDDIARVIRVGSAGPHMQGAEGRVVKVTDGWVYVEDRTGQGLFNYGGVKSYMFQPHDLRLVTERLADWEKELLGIETKQEEPEVKQGLKVGDTVRVLKTSNWHKQGETGKIAEIDRWGNLELNGWWLSPQNVELVTEKPAQFKAGDRVEANETRSGVVKGQKYTVASLDSCMVFGQILETTSGKRAFTTRFKLVTEKPKTRSQEIELEDVQKGDLIVCFFDNEGVEVRTKGTAHETDYDKDWMTVEGGYLTYRDDLDLKGIYLLERPEVKEPTKPEDALDKTLTYVVKPKNSYTGTYYLKFVADAWRFRCNDAVVRETSSTVYSVEADLIEGKTSWEKPVPYEPTDLELHTEAGYVGNIYVRPNNTPYKVTDEGKVMAWYKDTDKWSEIGWDFQTFHSSMQAGAFTKIS